VRATKVEVPIMSEFFFSTGWGAFTLMVLMQIPFAVVFGIVVYHKAFVASSASDTPRKKLSRLESGWLLFAGALFVAVNGFSLSYFPMISTASATAKAEHDGQEIQEVDVLARSWGYQISDRELEVGKPIRFSAKSADTMHSFSVYHPDGRVLFTMQLVPGLEQAASQVYTFQEPGVYTVRCLEYCGLAHHGMRDRLVVTDSRGGLAASF
jgi:cytochrome c oxidase subunit 2